MMANRGLPDPPEKAMDRLFKQGERVRIEREKYDAMLFDLYCKYNASAIARELGISRQAMSARTVRIKANQ